MKYGCVQLQTKWGKTSPTFCCQILQIPNEINFLLDAPQLWLSLGQNLAEDKIKEGDDVYFDCEINANPKTGKITWKHNVSVWM